MPFSSAWTRSMALEIGDRYHTLASWMSHNHYHRCYFVDFRYDPFDYALNFDDGEDADDACHAEDLYMYCILDFVVFLV